jgi:toxin ParE1/3/4
MARRVIWTDDALRELQEIAEFVEAGDPAESGRIVTAAFDAAEQRVHFPESGSIVLEIDDPHVREVSVKRAFRLIDDFDANRVRVLAFFRSRRLLRRGDIPARHARD